jgi:hypothetical protein
VKYQQRTINLVSEAEREIAIAALKNVPIGLQMVLREPVKVRTVDQNALMWSGALPDIANQAFVAGKQFDEETWHEHFKREYLPEDDDPYLAELVKNAESYRKWKVLPSGERALVGSTGDLSKYGFSQYMEQIYAFGASLGVLFHVRKL